MWLLSLAVLVPAAGQAAVSASYLRTAPLQSDPGNEIRQQTYTLDASMQVHASADGTRRYTAGISADSTTLDFDDSRLGDVDLLKAQLPVSGSYKVSDRRLYSWTLSPGWHGDADNFSDADFRVEGQFLAIFPRSRKQWILGLGYGEDFGDPQVFPVLGVIMQRSDRLKLTLVLPQTRIDYKVNDRVSYNVRLEAAGAQWTWEAGAIAPNTEAGNLTLSATRFTVGGELCLKAGTTLFADIGAELNRSIEIERQSDPSINGSVDLGNSWIARVGVRLP